MTAKPAHTIDVILCGGNLSHFGEEWKPPGDISEFANPSLRALQTDTGIHVIRGGCQGKCRAGPCNYGPFGVVDSCVIEAKSFKDLYAKIQQYAATKKWSNEKL